MKRTLFKEDVVDLWISDQSNNAFFVSERLRQTGLFEEIIYREVKDYTYNQSKFKNLIDVIYCNFGLIKSYKLYDEIIYYNLEMELFSVADFYNKIGQPVNWSRYEEGILSYDTDFETGYRVKITKKIRKCISRPDISLQVDKYYCSFPELKKKHLEWNLIQIPCIAEDDMEFVNILNKVFDYEPQKITQQYIFFASSSDIDGKPFGETEYVLKLSDRVGKDNLLVKMHPRDNRSVYQDYGISVMEASHVPWEVIQLNNMDTDKYLLTVNSGAFLSVSALCEKEILGQFLFKELHSYDEQFNYRSKEIEEKLNCLHKMGKCLKINIPTDDVLCNL